MHALFTFQQADWPRKLKIIYAFILHIQPLTHAHSKQLSQMVADGYFSGRALLIIETFFAERKYLTEKLHQAEREE